MKDTAWLHDLDPFLIHFYGNIGIRWYGLAYVTGFIVCYFFMIWFCKNKNSPLNADHVGDFMTGPILGVLIGGRLGYALFYSPDLFMDFRSQFPYWGLLAVWEGGMASHGGFIGVLLSCLYFSKKLKVSFFHLGDLVIFGAMIGIAFGRIANFINGELMGRVCQAGFPLAVKFPQDMYRWIGYDPEKLQRLKEPARLLGIKIHTWYQWIDNLDMHKIQFYELIDRIIFQIQSGNQKIIEVVRPILEPRHPSQIYACFTEALFPLLLVLIFWKKPRKPGLVGSLFLILYSIGRIFNEQFRLPDAPLSNLSEQPLGITRGQFISLWLLLGGVLLFIWCLKRKTSPLGGWNSLKKTN